MNLKHVMVDLETLGTTADAVILSVGAVKFDLDSDRIDDAGFYASISIESNLLKGRRISESTLIWWMGREAAAQTVFTEPKSTLETGLIELSDWLGEDDKYIWACGADFDTPMLAHAFTQHQMEVPWKYWNSRCFRTYKNLPHAAQVNFVPEGTKHNALTDAFNQARYLQLIQRVVSGREPSKKNSMVKTA